MMKVQRKTSHLKYLISSTVTIEQVEGKSEKCKEIWDLAVNVVEREGRIVNQLRGQITSEEDAIKNVKELEDKAKDFIDKIHNAKGEVPTVLAELGFKHIS